MTIEVSGTVHAALSEDGFVDVDLTTARRTGLGATFSKGEGHVQFRTKIGETAEVLLPAPTGHVPSGNGTSIDLGRAFAGHRVSLYLKVESLR